MKSEENTIELARQLISRASVSPDDGGCQALLAGHLSPLGFDVEHLPFGPVKNLWACRRGQAEGPLFVFAGHTDVVPTGPVEAWRHDPFAATMTDGILHGRGAADMKGSLAAMVTASRRFINDCPDYRGTIGFLITSDEEDAALDGTVKVMDTLHERGIFINYCLIGEPSSTAVTGDVIRVGRRGSLNGELTVHGVPGHVAYLAAEKNPIHALAPALAELVAVHWDKGNEFFPPTSFQISNIHAGVGVNNVTPGDLTLQFNFRFSTASTEATLKAATEDILNRHGLSFEMDWRLSGQPFLTTGGDLIPAVQGAVRKHTNIEAELSTAGGTSDGRFIAPGGTEVVELGPCNATIHKVDEQIKAAELHQLADIYFDILRSLLGGTPGDPHQNNPQ